MIEESLTSVMADSFIFQLMGTQQVAAHCAEWQTWIWWSVEGPLRAETSEVVVSGHMFNLYVRRLLHSETSTSTSSWNLKWHREQSNRVDIVHQLDPLSLENKDLDFITGD